MNNANATPNPAAASWSPPKPTSVLPIVKLATDEVQLVERVLCKLCKAYQENLIAYDFLRVGPNCANFNCQFPITDHAQFHKSFIYLFT
jgi:hypothetical protein